MTPPRPLTVGEERLLRMVIGMPPGLADPPISRTTVQKCLALIDELRAELIRTRGTRVLSLVRPPLTSPPEDAA